MKKYLIITMKVFRILLFILIITSCEDFLTEKPKTQLSVNDFFRNSQDAQNTVNMLYWSGPITLKRVANHFANGNVEFYGSYNSGLFENDRAVGEEVYAAQNLTLSPLNMDQEFANIWSVAYQGISRANFAIKYIPTTENISQAELNSLLGIAKFWRAYSYFWMVKFFGGLPLITEPYESLENIYLPRSSAEDVYNLIISDLQWTLDNAGLADVLYYFNDFVITKGIVATLLADVYLQSAGFPVQEVENYEKAANTARMVINSGVYKLIEHINPPEESAYNVMRISEQEPEYIYASEYDPVHRTSLRVTYSIPSYAKPPGTKYSDMWNSYHPRDEFLWIYNPDKDLRIKNKQIWHTSIEKEGEIFEFNAYAPYTWYDEKAIYETGVSGKDLPIYRYAEVLLIGAEAIAQSEGVTNEAVSYLTDVRSRAYWTTDKSEIKSYLEGLSKEQFIEEVWKERYRELVLDCKIWPDIQRTRMYPVTSGSNPGVVNFVNVIGHSNPFGATYQEHNLLWPLPNILLQKNPELDQNPGY